MQSGIYEIVSPSGKRYIGSAVNIRGRWAGHRMFLRRGKHHCAGLQAAFNKYGPELEYRIVEHCAREFLIEREQFHMDSHPRRQLYNSAMVAGSCLGLRHTDETKARISKLHKGRKHSDEHRANVAAAKRNMTDETKAKIKAALAGRITCPHAVEAARKANTGRALSEEHKAKIRAGNLGKKRSEATRRLQAQIRTGRKHSPETLAKLRVPCSPEKAEKIRQAQLRRSAERKALLSGNIGATAPEPAT